MFKQPNLAAVLAIAATTIAAASGLSVTPAEARFQCIYAATNGGSWSIATQGTARKSGRACRRAKRRCKRKLRTAMNQGKFAVFNSRARGCYKHSVRGAGF